MNQKGQGEKERKPKLGYDHITPKRIRALMDAHNESEAALGRAIGKETKTVNYIARGINGLSIDTVVAIAKHFSVSTDYLLGFSDVKSASAEVRAIAEYTGLSADSINALHYMNECNLRHEDEKSKSPSLKFINRVLEEYNYRLNRADAFRSEMYYDFPSILSDLEEWITGSGDPGLISVSNGSMRIDDAFRQIALQNVREKLRQFAHEDGKFEATKRKSKQFESYLYEYFENLDEEEKPGSIEEIYKEFEESLIAGEKEV